MAPSIVTAAQPTIDPDVQEERRMQQESSVTTVSWIPSEAMTGPMRLPMDLGVGHYDPPPPDHVDDATLDDLRDRDALRFANRLAAWIQVEDGDIVAAGYSGRGVVGATIARLGLGSVTFPGIGYPIIQEEPVVTGGTARFVQTAGGRTGAPFPHRIARPPWLRIIGPTAWTTLALEIATDGSASFELVGASPFPRHWIYDHEGALQAKSGTIDFRAWARTHDFDRSPWNHVQREALVVDVETADERALSKIVMGAGVTLRSLAPDEVLTRQGERGDEVHLVLDGVLQVEVDDNVVAEIGPGAIVGERARLEGGIRTSTVRSVTRTRIAAFRPDALDEGTLTRIAADHRREDHP